MLLSAIYIIDLLYSKRNMKKKIQSYFYHLSKMNDFQNILAFKVLKKNLMHYKWNSFEIGIFFKEKKT